jgi:hypothetical protein
MLKELPTKETIMKKNPKIDVRLLEEVRKLEQELRKIGAYKPPVGYRLTPPLGDMKQTLRYNG